MNESFNDIQETVILIKYYGFDLNGYKIKELVVKWTKLYPHHWLPLGVTEAIYQGRLKAVSVEQILNVWQKKGQIIQSFSYEFSRLIKPDLNFCVKNQEELNGIFSNTHEDKSQDLTENHLEKKLEISEENLMLDRTEENEDWQEKMLYDEFEPLNDYSQCFQKLKSFIHF